MEKTTVASVQHLALLEEISTEAGRLATLVDQLYDIRTDPDAHDSMVGAVDVLARRIGWFADVARVALGENPLHVCEARDWLMPGRCRGDGAGPGVGL